MIIEEVSTYAQQASSGRAKVERISRSTVLITFTSTRLNSNKVANLVRLCGGRKAYDIRVIDGQLAIEVRLKRDSRLTAQNEQKMRRYVKIIEKQISDAGKTTEEWLAEVDQIELPEIEDILPELNELNDTLCAPAHTSHETK